MASLNKVVLLGNLTKDPELKVSPSGTQVAKLRIAVNEQFRDRTTGQLKEVACYVDVTVWARQAEACGQYLQKGSQIIVDGRLSYEEWTTPAGDRRNRLSVRADRVQFIYNTRRQENQGEQSHPPREESRPSAVPPGAEHVADDENLPF